MYYIGLDIGGTGIQAGLVSEDGKILFRRECRTDVNGGFDKIVEDMTQLINDLVYKNNLSMDEIESIGLGVPGLVTKKGQVTAVNLGWKNVDLVNTLKSKFENIPVFAGNDATVAALAEAKSGSMKDCEIGVMYTLGTGVGGGIIINGKAIVGAHGVATELGHVILGENYFDCNCGNNGCLETFCSATAIIKYAQKLISEGRESRILEFAEGKIEEINAKMVFDAYREGDAVAIETISRFKDYLAKGIANMVNTLDPDVISLGGGVSRASDIILDGLDDLIKKYIIFKEEDFADIVIATLGNDAGIIGAAFLS